MPTREKKIAMGFHFLPRPSVMKYMGPPCKFPAESLPRYMTAREHVKYLVATPRRAEIHIQKIAPGPPAVIATATPLTFPIPTVPERAVARAW
jgi:hypothetical protein